MTNKTKHDITLIARTHGNIIRRYKLTSLSHWESYTTASSKSASRRKTSPPLPPASLYESKSAVKAATWHHTSAYAALGCIVGTLYTCESGDQYLCTKHDVILIAHMETLK
mgnify:CR=1 FL=1